MKQVGLRFLKINFHFLFINNVQYGKASEDQEYKFKLKIIIYIQYMRKSILRGAQV